MVLRPARAPPGRTTDTAAPAAAPEVTAHDPLPPDTGSWRVRGRVCPLTLHDPVWLPVCTRRPGPRGCRFAVLCPRRAGVRRHGVVLRPRKLTGIDSRTSTTPGHLSVRRTPNARTTT